MALYMETNRTIGHVTDRDRNKGKNEFVNDPVFVGYRLNMSSKYDSVPTVRNHEVAMKKITALKSLLKNDPKAADLKWSLFVAASNTYRFDCCLTPFPPMYIKNECKDIDALRKAIESVPPLAIVLNELSGTDAYQNDGSAIELLYWVLVKLREPQIKSTAKLNDNVMSLAPSEQSASRRLAPPPNFIFQIISSKQSTAEQKWKTAAEGHSTFYAYYGSRLENFYSIIHYGLQTNTRNKSFDKRVCISGELATSLSYSPVGYGWGGSIIGGGLSCVALCELINCPGVKNQGTRIGGNLTEAHSESISDEHCLLANSELVRIRYLLVYSQEDRIARSDGSLGLFAWFKQHRLLTFVLGYVVLLASVGLMRDKKVAKLYRLFLSKTRSHE